MLTREIVPKLDGDGSRGWPRSRVVRSGLLGRFATATGEDRKGSGSDSGGHKASRTVQHSALPPKMG
jgi:hypothetical protein